MNRSSIPVIFQNRFESLRLIWRYTTRGILPRVAEHSTNSSKSPHFHYYTFFIFYFYFSLTSIRPTNRETIMNCYTSMYRLKRWGFSHTIVRTLKIGYGFFCLKICSKHIHLYGSTKIL